MNGNQTLYVVHWKAIRTGATGHGTGAFPKKEAEEYAKALNKDSAGILTYWIEPQKEEIELKK